MKRFHSLVIGRELMAGPFDHIRLPPAGNSLSAILDGKARLVFLSRDEEYVITMPYAHCKGMS